MLSLLQMSLTGAVLITVVIVIRALAINRMPKKAFLFLWAAALLRLLVPFRLVSPISIYRAAHALLSVSADKALFPAVDAPLFPSGNLVVPSDAGPDSPAGFAPHVQPFFLLWFVIAVTAALAFLITHLKSRRIYRTSLPLELPFIKSWAEAHRLRRPVQFRYTDRLEAPLTYGILWPVILLPKNLDWEDTETLGFILTHEMAHIQRFDALTKWILAAALCFHWFNPFVWAMYILANRDLELACDETVLRRYGLTQKSSYALALVGMEEHRSRPAPLASGFSRNALKERITAIMTSRRITPAAMAAAVLVTGLTVGVFATSAPADPVSAKTASLAERSPETTPSDYTEPYAFPSSGEEQIPDYSGEDYERLIAALVLPGWEKMSISEFNRRTHAVLSEEGDISLLYDRVVSSLPDNDPYASYLKNTVRFSQAEYSTRQEEVYSGKRRDPECSSFYENIPEYREDSPHAFSMAEYRFSYRILDQDTLTVEERDAFLAQILNNATAFLQKNAQNSLTQKEFEDALQKIGKAASTEHITFTGCKIDGFL